MVMNKRINGKGDLSRIFAVIVLISLLTGCISQIPRVEDSANGAVGTSINLLLERAARPESWIYRSGQKVGRYRLENGHFAYTEPVREGCILHWEVDAEGIILGYRMQGNRCY